MKTATSPQKTIEFYSESGQDRWLYENLFREKRNGIYIECGALDGLLHSNTLFFEREMQWTGVLIEANPMLLGALHNNRPENVLVSCALASELSVQPFDIVANAPIGWSGLFSSFSGRRLEDMRDRAPQAMHQAVSVQTRTLIGVLRESFVGEVDLLSLDVEGAEFDVLMDYPFEEIPIDVILVEDNYQDDLRTRNLLLANGYDNIARIGNDEVWKRK